MPQTKTKTKTKSSSPTEIRRVTAHFRPSQMEIFAALHFQDYITDGFPGFHRASYAAMETYLNYIEQSPRGFGKSVRATLVRPAYALCTLKARDYVVASHGLDEAKDRVRRLRRSFEEKAELRVMYGVEIGPQFKGKWSDEYLELKVRGTLCSVRAKGMNTQIRGIHFDEGVIDDPEETKGAKSPTVRRQVWDVFERSIMPALNPKTSDGTPPKLLIIGTPIHVECLVERVFHNEEDRFNTFHRMRFTAIENGDTCEMTGVEMGESIWPERFPVQLLNEFRRRYGERAFQSEYMCSPMSEGEQMWYAEFFERRYTECPPNDRLVTVTSVDPAKTITDFKDGSQTGIVTVSKEKYEDDPKFYIRAALAKHLTPHERAKEAVRQAVEYGATWILVEDSTRTRPGSIGGSDVAELIRQEALALGHQHRFAVVTTYSKGEDKATRGLTCVPIGEQGRIYFPKHLAGHIWSLYQQLLVFPSGAKNDLADAFHNAIRHLDKSRVRGISDWPDRPVGMSKRSLLNRRQMRRGGTVNSWR